MWSDHQKATQAIAIVALCLLAAAVAVELYHFVRLSVFYLSLPVLRDSDIYFAMGRGWLNRIALYRDLFEIKPPLIFLLAALSLIATGTNTLFTILLLLFLGLLGPVLALFSYFTLRGSDHRTQWVAVALSLLLGLTIAVQALDRSLGLEPEGFALFFAIVPALCLSVPVRHRWMVALDLLAGLSLGIAAMLKEPFGPAGLLALLVFIRSKHDFVRLLRIGLAAGATCVCILAATHSLNAYFTIYLPEAFGGRSFSSVVYTNYQDRIRFAVPSPLWVRSLNAYRIFTDFSSTLLAAFFFLCLCLWPALRNNDSRLRTIITSVIMLAALLVSFHQINSIHQLVAAVHGLGQAVPWTDPTIVHLLVLATGSTALAILVGALAICRFGISWKVIIFALGAAVGLALVNALVTFGGISIPQYLIFAMPVLIALGIYALTWAGAGDRFLRLAVLGILLVLNALRPGQYGYAALAESFAPGIDHAERMHEPAKALDRVLSQCQIDRYLIGSTDFTLLDVLAAQTLHSPYQIFYGSIRAVGGFVSTSLDQTPNPYFASKLERDIQKARVI